MAGLCGVVGDRDGSIEELVDAIRWRDDQDDATFVDGRVSVGYVDCPGEFEPQPVETGSGEFLWTWGTVLGHERKGEYERRPAGSSVGEFCADRYDEYGLPFVAGLNSEFAGVVYDPAAETVTLYTDRLGSRPVYYAHADDGTLVFSVLLQSLGAHPGVELAADPPFLSEFLAYSRAFGTRTPVEGVRAVPPASVVRFDLDGDRLDGWRYWWPNPTPRSGSFDRLVGAFTDAFRAAVEDRRRLDEDPGLLLSAGADSRLLLETLDGDVRAFHMNERLESNGEARTAERVAETAGVEFEFLQRDRDYVPAVLEAVGDRSNCNGLFHQAHTVGFSDELADRVDGLYAGHYGDTLLGDVYVPQPDRPSGVLQHLTLPSPSSAPSTVAEYEAGVASPRMPGYNGAVPFATGLPPARETFRANVSEGGERVESHGVTYPGWRALVEFGMVHPLTNTRSMLEYETLVQVLPTRYPFLDNRVVDVALELTAADRHRRDVVSRALSGLDSGLAEIPDPRHGISLDRSAATRYYARKAKALAGSVRARAAIPGGGHAGPRPDASAIDDGGSWPDYEALLRVHPFVETEIDEHERRIRASPYLDYGAARSCYRAHLDGEDRTRALLALLSVLGSSLDLE